jgi:hypothetical protein
MASMTVLTAFSVGYFMSEAKFMFRIVVVLLLTDSPPNAASALSFDDAPVPPCSSAMMPIIFSAISLGYSTMLLPWLIKKTPSSMTQ